MSFYSKWWIYQKVYLKRLRAKQVKIYLEQVKAKEKPLFIHINKTAGSSIARSLGITEIHYTLAEYEQLYAKQFGEDLPLDTQVWTAIRNPFDKVSSEYHYRIKHNQNNMQTHPIDFKDWVEKAYSTKDSYYRDREIMFMPQVDWIASKNEYPLHFIRFENLQSDYKKMASAFNGQPLVWRKKSKNSDYKSMYTPHTKAIIATAFSADLERFNYSFE